MAVAAIFQFINASYYDTLSDRKSGGGGGGVSPQELTVLWSLTTALMIPGGLVGSLLGGWMADRFGRSVIWSNFIRFLWISTSFKNLRSN